MPPDWLVWATSSISIDFKLEIIITIKYKFILSDKCPKQQSNTDFPKTTKIMQKQKSVITSQNCNALQSFQ